MCKAQGLISREKKITAAKKPPGPSCRYHAAPIVVVKLLQQSKVMLDSWRGKRVMGHQCLRERSADAGQGNWAQMLQMASQKQEGKLMEKIKGLKESRI